MCSKRSNGTFAEEHTLKFLSWNKNFREVVSRSLVYLSNKSSLHHMCSPIVVIYIAHSINWLVFGLVSYHRNIYLNT